MTSTELIFEVNQEEDGGYCAQALGSDIFTQADTWDDLKNNVREAVSVHFDEGEDYPRIIRLHFVRDEVIAL
ncbi:MAG TPA: 2-oxoisovalerate dehydrogenase [bacterium]